MRPLVLFVFAQLLSGNLFAGSILDYIGQGDSLYLADDYPASIAAYKQALASDSLSPETNWKLARSLNIQAELEPKEKQLALYEKAAISATRCIGGDSLIAEGHFQLARVDGRIALFKGVFKSVSLAKQVKREADKAIAINPNHDGAYHILGRWHREVAQKPKFLRVPLGLGEADKKKGLEYFVKALKLNPNYINHHLEYGISLLDIGQKDQARAQFEQCLALPAAHPLEFKYQNEAKEYLARLKQKN